MYKTSFICCYNRNFVPTYIQSKSDTNDFFLFEKFTTKKNLVVPDFARFEISLQIKLQEHKKQKAQIENVNVEDVRSSTAENVNKTMNQHHNKLNDLESCYGAFDGCGETFKGIKGA